MESIHKVKKGVESCHRNIGEGQVDDKVVGYCSHAPVSQNNPDDSDVPSDRHQDDQSVGYGPERHLEKEEDKKRHMAQYGSVRN